MPYAIRHAKSKLWVKRYPNRSYHKREWVGSLEQATTWPDKGPAKLAANQLATYSQGLEVEIVQVSTVETIPSNVESHTVKAKR